MSVYTIYLYTQLNNEVYNQMMMTIHYNSHLDHLAEDYIGLIDSDLVHDQTAKLLPLHLLPILLSPNLYVTSVQPQRILRNVENSPVK